MVEYCNVDIRYYDKKTNRVLRTNTRERVIVGLRKISGGYDISVKSMSNVDLFITKMPVVFRDQQSEGKMTIKIPEQLCTVTIRDSTEENIISILEGLSHLSPVKALMAGNQNIAERGKENIPLNLQRLNALPTREKADSTTHRKCESLLKGVATTALSPGMRKEDSVNLASPTKRFVTFGTGTPSKNTDSPCNIRKQARFKPSSPVASIRKVACDSTSEIQDNFKVTSEQERITTACLAGRNVFFTGGAGTGKSTLLLLIVEKLTAKYGRSAVFVTATTGLAACAIGGTTVHQFAGISVTGNMESFLKSSETVKIPPPKPYIIKQLVQAKVLIVDEVSMMGPDVLEKLNSIAQKCRKNSLPMGGLQVIFTGDFFQLPPVSTAKVGYTMIDFKNASGGGNTQHNTAQRATLSQSSTALSATTSATVSSSASQLQNGTSSSTSTSSNAAAHSLTPRYSALSQLSQQIGQPLKSYQTRPTVGLKEISNDTKQSRFCFQSSVWAEVIGKNTFVLTNIFRQKDAGFAAMLNSIRCGELTDSIIATLQQCVGRQFDSSDDILPTRIFTHRKDVDELNSVKLASLPGEVVTFKSIDIGEVAFLRSLQSHCSAKEIIQLKVGAQVIFTKSIDPSKGLVNGTKAVIVRFTRDTRRPVIKLSNGLERTIMNEVFSINCGGKIMAQRTQLPLDLAWGISVHKSQGMTVEKAILSLRNVFEYGQAYVALSRVRSLEGLSLDMPLTKEQVKSHGEVVAFYKNLSTKN